MNFDPLLLNTLHRFDVVRFLRPLPTAQNDQIQFFFVLGAWIAEWSSHLTFEHWYAMPWAVRLILVDDYSISAQA